MKSDKTGWVYQASADYCSAHDRVVAAYEFAKWMNSGRDGIGEG